MTGTMIHLGLSPKAAEYVLESISQRHTYEGRPYDPLGTQIMDEIDKQLAPATPTKEVVVDQPS